MDNTVTSNTHKDIWKGTFIHEMFHVFGIAHMQRRNDRDKFIEVLSDNIEQEKLPQYQKCTDCTIWGPYECNSIMHYEQGSFGKDELPTMKGFGPNCTEFGNSIPTKNDWNSLRQKLGCNEEIAPFKIVKEVENMGKWNKDKGNGQDYWHVTGLNYDSEHYYYGSYSDDEYYSSDYYKYRYL